MLKKTLLFILKAPFSSGLHLITIYRLNRWVYKKSPALGNIITPPSKFLMRFLTSCEISPLAQIGKKVKFPHPLCIVIGEGVKIGDNVKIWQQVTIGSHGKKGAPLEYPVINDNVRIFAGATIIGGIKIGTGATIGAHSVVTSDIPDHTTAVGSPAKLIPLRHDGGVQVTKS